MRFDELFEMRKLTGTKLKDYIRSNGFSKVSFCKKTEISRPTLDKILNGEIDSKSTFDKHLNKILTSLSIDPDTLMGFSPRIQSADAVFSENAPIDYQVNDKAKMEYDLLQDILNLCSVYYQRQKANLGKITEKEDYNGKTEETTVKIGDWDDWKRFDAGMNIGVGIWYDRFNFDITYQRGFIKTWESNTSNVLIRLGVAF